MKGLAVTLTVVLALAMAGVGGTLADFSDSEEELDDILQAGSLDLEVNGTNDPGVESFEIRFLIPEKIYEVTKTVRNVGTIDGYLYIHFKNTDSVETNDKDLNGDGIIDDLDMPEPESVAEYGGQLGGKELVGMQNLGIVVSMSNHVAVTVAFGPDAGSMEVVDMSSLDVNGDGLVTLNEAECTQVLVDVLPACSDEYYLSYLFMLEDIAEEAYGLDIYDETDPHEVKWNWWPTNCLQGDTTSFDVMYELLQTDYTPPGG